MTRIERAALALLAVLTAARLWWCGRFGLSPDEAYYALWAQHLDLAYYSKGPGVALVIRAMTSLLGHSELGVRAAAPLLALVTSLVLWRLARELFGGEVAGWTLLAINLIPLFNVGGLLMTIDPLSVAAWSLALLTGWKALARGPGFNAWWPVTGAIVGAGFLCKYTNAAELVGFALVLGLTAERRRDLAGAAFGSCLAGFLPFALPPVLWNARHDWVTLRHLEERGGLAGSFGIHPKEWFEFLTVHFGVWSPVVFALMLAAIPAAWRAARTELAPRYLLCVGLPLVVGYFAIALNAAGEANWTGPGCLSLLLLAAWHFVPRARASLGMRRTALAGLGLAALLSLLIVNTDLLRAAGFPLKPKADPSTRLRGWREAAASLDATRAGLERADGRPTLVVANHYGPAAALAFYSHDGLTQGERQTFFVRPTHAPKNQFWFWDDWRTRAAARVLYVTDRGEAPPEEVASARPSWRELPPIVVERHGATLRTLRVFAGEPVTAR